MAGEEHVPKPSDNHSERSEKQTEKPQTSQETAEHSVIGGHEKEHQQLHKQALESNPNTHTGSSLIEHPNNNFESIQILEAIPGTDEKRVVAERAKRGEESPVKTFDKRPDAPEQPSKAAPDRTPSYMEGLATIADTSTTPQEAEARLKKFDKFYQLGKEAERQAAGQNPPEKIAMAAGARPALQPEVPQLDQRPDLKGFVSVTDKAETFQTIKQDFSKQGESLLDVAKRLAPPGMSSADVEEWSKQNVRQNGNDVSDTTQVLEAGTKVTLRPFERAASARPDDSSVYTVQPGDSLWKIGSKTLGPDHSNSELNQFITEIGRLNNLSNLNVIHPGDQLRLPTLAADGNGEDQNIRPEPRPEPRPELRPELRPEPTPVPVPDNPELPPLDSVPDRPQPSPEILPDEPESPVKPIQIGSEGLKPVDQNYNKYEEYLDDPGFSKEEHDRIGTATGREHLIEVAKKHGIDLADTITLKHIENRVAKKEVSPEEIKKTYEQLERLLETPSKAGVTDKHREIIAQQILEQTAEPTNIDQGSFNTCNVTTVECRCFSRQPSEAAKLITDIALNGEYQCNVLQTDGTFKPVTVRQNPEPFDENALAVPAENGIRSYASQIFQVASVNIHYQNEGNGTWYEQKRYNKMDKKDNGERLWDKNNNEVSRTPGGLPQRNPGLPDYAFVEIYNAITGRNDAGFLLESPTAICGPDKHITHITSPTELEQRLLEIEKARNFPVIIGVDCASEPFWSDGHFGAAGGAGDKLGGGHVVTVTGIEHGPPMKIKVDNQWSNQSDHLNEVTAMTSRQLYFTMLEPLVARDELTQVIRNDRENGHRDAWNELEYERLRELCNRKIDKNGLGLPKVQTREIELDVINTLASAFDSHADQPDEWQKPGIMNKLGQVTEHLPPESQIRIQHEEARLGLITHDEYKHALIDYGKFAGSATDEQFDEFMRLLSELSPAEQQDVRNLVK